MPLDTTSDDIDTNLGGRSVLLVTYDLVVALGKYIVKLIIPPKPQISPDDEGRECIVYSV